MDIELPFDFKEFLKLLNENEVKYLLIGGYIDLQHLKINKKAAGRLKDLADLENLP